MRVLLDTHAMFWWMVEREKLSATAYSAIRAATTDVFVSVASAWEMSIKVGAGKWPGAAALVNEFEHQMALERFRLLPIAVAHVRLSGLMATPHRDPFDRLLAAQAVIEGLALVTADPKLAALGATTLW